MSRCYDLPSGPELDTARQALAALLPSCHGCALDAEDGERYCRDCEHDGVLTTQGGREVRKRVHVRARSPQGARAEARRQCPGWRPYNPRPV